MITGVENVDYFPLSFCFVKFFKLLYTYIFINGTKKFLLVNKRFFLPRPIIYWYIENLLYILSMKILKIFGVAFNLKKRRRK